MKEELMNQRAELDNEKSKLQAELDKEKSKALADRESLERHMKNQLKIQKEEFEREKNGLLEGERDIWRKKMSELERKFQEELSKMTEEQGGKKSKMMENLSLMFLGNKEREDDLLKKMCFEGWVQVLKNDRYENERKKRLHAESELRKQEMELDQKQRDFERIKNEMSNLKKENGEKDSIISKLQRELNEKAMSNDGNARKLEEELQKIRKELEAKKKELAKQELEMTAKMKAQKKDLEDKHSSIVKKLDLEVKRLKEEIIQLLKDSEKKKGRSDSSFEREEFFRKREETLLKENKELEEKLKGAGNVGI
jgi:hypothetical protein